MAKRGYKIQEFVAHSSNVNCLTIGKKGCRLFVTGGDDHKVNLWTIGKPTSVSSLSGHTSPVESVAFDSGEVLVLAGSSSGVIRLWDLEESKMVRTVAGHRSNCTSVEFHPFGEFFASGSTDTNLKIWDNRKKGCIHTYKGHSQGINTIKFTPDGRWVVSGGFDNVVKVWDLTAGKLLHDFNFHDGHITSLDFHPLEFLLATGSADKTVKFWDLETFELIGSVRREDTGVRSIAFHPDGRTLFSGHEDGLRVFSWEPVICHDTVDMGWTTLDDICIHDGKLLGCSHYRNSVGVWVADISLIEPYRDDLDLKKDEGTKHQHILKGSKLEKVEVDIRPTSGFRSMSPDESKEIKNIYIDSSGGKPVALPKSASFNSLKVDLTEESKEMYDLETAKQNPATKVHLKSNEQATIKTLIMQNIVPHDIPDAKDSTKPVKETITFSKTKPGMLLKPAHARRASTGRFDVDKFQDVNSETFCDTTGKLDSAKIPKFPSGIGSQNEVKESCEDKHPIKNVTDKSEKTVSPYNFFNLTKRVESSTCNEEITPVKYVNGVAVVRGRTRSLVERFERRESVQVNEDQINPPLPTISEAGRSIHNENRTDSYPTTVFERKEVIPSNEDQTSATSMVCEKKEIIPRGEDQTNELPSAVFERKEKIPRDEVQTNAYPATVFERKEKIPRDEGRINESPSSVFERKEKIPRDEVQTNAPPSVFERKEKIPRNEVETNAPPSTVFERKEKIPRDEVQTNASPSAVFERKERIPRSEVQTDASSTTVFERKERLPRSEVQTTVFERKERIPRSEVQTNASPSKLLERKERVPRSEAQTDASYSTVFERKERIPRSEVQTNVSTSTVFERKERLPRSEIQTNTPPSTVFERKRIPRNEVQTKAPHSTVFLRKERVLNNEVQTNASPATVSAERKERILRNEDRNNIPSLPNTTSNIDESSCPDILKVEPQVSLRDSNSSNEMAIIEGLMETHDATLSNLRSRLTKLQVVRHFWERNDIKGAINALRKLPDQSVQADVISILVEKMEILTLDLLSSLLPVLTGLLDSKTERHVKVSLDMLLKFVAVFGSTIKATISAPPSVGVDLHREQRRECCNECFMELQKIQTTLPMLIRKGGLLAKSSMELNLVLQRT
ncbi:katanin p80 WD40 repeat-containing subunit B1 homolog KTN80.1-like [Vicia villosa]|uniref:katanin p80 WD40 repeat-containing subunit B1 homolog KTN80.1-like n=1 Tax=Vicia villosa TaxID=3911 RepID=UPI00273B1B11|nr:katanin p80 WD40 repeat-containing subunit B1 homolog KTN80.1-like [Vicia villosa]